ncbi:TonB-dependent siderophore receptor [Vibrio fluvialis]|uniref:Enterobactin receptor VctA n=1 Tax=Vibrio fluvialis PG41 TaxID=1336752 RepID=S7I8Y1_VIBFL|nr:TonB-dependent siderophore receptor [Vibrio fluvialis]EPP24613.1 Enterobactin receptor VctA [Vibrio fluvialis PG41]MBY7801458.1 TonB-dependent siderophore receptor [Vibrio fluvialis]MBY7840752.1 TonB-dependent siderophore receptor [Vibrio fluvialis]MBY7892875.1 TonB-dependent siderophore receptor [Vibrio fluvialis]MBY8106212.1 TonB-dependent siderophore receptor [Vibrio fluvialis]
MRSIHKSVVCLAISAALSNMAFAQQEETQTDNVVVWGTKVSSSSESLGTDDLSVKQADHMSDLLRDIPGVDVGGTHSVNQRINIRGLNETDLDIRLDGASQHANMFHHIGNLTLNPDILKSAYIQVGNNSVTQSGLGGAVYFETKNAKDLLRGDEQFGVRVFGGYNSNASEQGSVTVYGQLSDDVDAMLYAQGIARDNFEDGNGDETFGVKGDTYNILGKVGYEPAAGHRFQLAYDLYRDEGDYSPRPDMNGSANTNLTADDLLPTKYNRDTVTASYKLTKEKHSGTVTLYSSETEIERDESKVTGRWPRPKDTNTATNRNVGLNAKFQSDYQLLNLDNRVVYGADVVDQTSKSSYAGSSYMDESRLSNAIFAENTLSLTESWNITAGLRYDDVKRKAVNETNNFDDVTWSLGTEWAVNSDWTLFANARSLFKAPELLETFVMYQQTSYLADDIKAETGLNTQGGVRFDKRFDDHFVAANLTVFRTEIDDYIMQTWDSAVDGYRFENTGDVVIKGFEVSATYAYQAFSSRLSYSRSDTEDKSTGGPMLDANGRSADMGDSIALNLGYHADSIDTLFGWTSIVVLDETNVEENSDKKEGYDTHNLYAQWMPYAVPDLTVTFGIDNIFDELYVSHASRTGANARAGAMDDYEPGRSFKISASYQF